MNMQGISPPEKETNSPLFGVECNRTKDEIMTVYPKDYKNPFVPDYRADYDYTFMHIRSSDGNECYSSFPYRKQASKVVFVLPNWKEHPRHLQWCCNDSV